MNEMRDEVPRDPHSDRPQRLEISENHKRAIAAALGTVADWLDRIAAAATRPAQQDRLRRLEGTLSADRQRRIAERIAKARAVLDEMAACLRLPHRVDSIPRQIAAACAVAWEDLVETQSRHLRRYGPLPAGAATYIDSRIDDLIEIVGQIDAAGRGEPSPKSRSTQEVPKMKIQTDATLLSIYLGQNDRRDGKPLYQAIVEQARRMHMAGATVLRGPMGFGAASRIHTAKILRLSEDLPILVQIVDSPEKIAAFLATVTDMVSSGLITLQAVNVVKYGTQEGPAPAPTPGS